MSHYYRRDKPPSKQLWGVVHVVVWFFWKGNWEQVCLFKIDSSEDSLNISTWLNNPDASINIKLMGRGENGNVKGENEKGENENGGEWSICKK